MSGFHSDYKEQLVRAAEALFGSPAARPKRRIGRPRHVPLLAAIALGALLLAAAALAATQIIGFGAPVTASHARGREHPSASIGVGIPVAGAKSRPASAQLLAISVPDPGGGLPWGMRIVRTTRGLVCVQLGRLLDGRLGVLGQDGEFNDDGLFHELPVGVLDPDTCSQPADYVLYTSEGLPASGALPGPERPCLYPGAPQLRPSDPQPCPAADERTIAFGVLGPHAVSVSYKTQDEIHTVATTGSLGAYLIVLRQPPIHPRPLDHGRLQALLPPGWSPLRSFPTLGSSSSPLGRFPVSYQPAVVSTLVFRVGHRFCQTGVERQPVGPPACTKSIARTPAYVSGIPRGLHARITLKPRKTPAGYELELTFIAPAAVFDARTAYGVEYTMPSDPPCGRGGSGGQSIERDVARGQVLHTTVVVSQPPACHGVLHGRLVFGRQPDAFTGPAGGETVGRFSFKLP